MGIVVVLVLSASMSTLSSLVLTSSSTLTIDLIKPAVEKKKPMKESVQVLLMRIFIAAFLILSVIIALNPNTYISTLMSISWGALAGAFLAPFLYGLFSKKITRAAVWASFVSGVSITVIHMVLFSLGWFPGLVAAVQSLNCPLNLLSPINAGVFAMLFSLVLVPIVSIFTKKPEAEIVDYAFAGYKKDI
jgi:SSS family solute:Na+ symporter